MNLAKLIAKGRLEPIIKGDMIVGYQRRSKSRKAAQAYMLKVPKRIKKTAEGAEGK